MNATGIVSVMNVLTDALATEAAAKVAASSQPSFIVAV
jgi:hypothetical protein